jgi:[acyl-carrier-protein] S-malonyltransferase
MGKDLYDNFAEAKSVFEAVSKATGLDLAKLCFETDEETLRLTQNAQIALYTSSVAAWTVLISEMDGSQIHAVAGHSVGEYAALAAAGAFSVEAGAKLVQIRGQVMSEAGLKQPGTMAAVIGLAIDLLAESCREAGGIVAVANDNCPGQLVISGEVEAVQRAGEIAKEKGAKRIIPLNVSGAFHSPLMAEPAAEMGKALSGIDFEPPSRRVYANVTAEPVTDPGETAALLERQLRNPVRWTETIQTMRRDGIDRFIECGPGEVLGGLIRRIDKEAISLRVSDTATLHTTLEALGKTPA